ncbi:MAG: hypothetical protein K6G80_02035 [Treponema sp.]|nr:hypothetical protein [Treponema sp.]
MAVKGFGPGKGLVGSAAAEAVLAQKKSALKNLVKQEVSVPIADLTIEKIAEYLGDKYKVVTDKNGGFKDTFVRVAYAENRSIHIKVKADKKNPGSTMLYLHNEYGDMSFAERLEDGKDHAEEALLGLTGMNLGSGVKEQLKLAKTEIKEARVSGDSEKLYTAFLRLSALGVNGIILTILKIKAKKDWQKKESAKIPAICDAIVNELKAKAGVN